MTKIKLAGETFDVGPPQFGKLRKIIAAFNVINANKDNTDLMMEQSSIILSLLLDKSVDEIDKMPIGMMEVTVAISQVPEICGLVEGKPSGEAQAAGGTTSTAT